MKCCVPEPLYIVLPYFNYCGFKRRRELFIEFVERYRHLKLVVVEVLGPAPLGSSPSTNTSRFLRTVKYGSRKIS
jgi:hypothetical protein